MKTIKTYTILVVLFLLSNALNAGLDPRVKLEGRINSFVTSVLGKKNIYDTPLTDQELKDWNLTLEEVNKYLTDQTAKSEPVLWNAYQQTFPAITNIKNTQRSIASFYSKNPTPAEKANYTSFAQTMIKNVGDVKQKIDAQLKQVQDYKDKTTKGFFVRNRNKKLDSAFLVIYFLTAISSILDKMQKDYAIKAKA